MQAPDELQNLRKRAQWYRDFANVGSADARELRLALARHFDKLADEVEERQDALRMPGETGGHGLSR